MAVENKYTDSNIAVGNRAIAGRGGHELVVFEGYASIAAADDDGSIYRIVKDIPSSFRPVRATVQCTAITGGTDFELGVYDRNLGAVVSKGLFMTNQTLATASRALDGLANVTVADLGARKSIAELLGLTPSSAKPAYDLALTGDTVGTAAGDVRVILEGYLA